jgi:DNA-binding NarL/FixJ family response regulator
MNTTQDCPTLRVGIVHDDAIVACGLRAMLGTQPDMEVHHAEDAASLPGGCALVVCDFATGLALAQRARSAAGALPGGTAPRILVFTSSFSEQGICRALSLGVHGCLLSDASMEEIVRGVRTVAQGQRFLSAAVADRVAASFVYAPLTPRETDVLGGLGAGQCNKAIARHLGISVGTVKAHVSAIMDKMNAGSRTRAVSVAAQRGLLEALRPA